ncbi:hypothetical protein [Paludibacterium purpuratum]|uniref:DUF4136 domain-containing protein n=1 Tax=Paludibacterium purpuratum TaxID=1144873 RepID=A0A4R7AZ73_9NEIS|nr:hypothetical protein [Paludibacterium purpuratum]TDR73560.1 hypothetical protein DFP86_11367 [Paludibacterium purpuratum]
MNKRLLLPGALMLLASYVAAAAEPTYQLTCLPDNASPSLVENIHTRLALHGWQEARGKADYQLCFQVLTRQQIVADPAPYRYGPYWAPPVDQVVDVPYLSLRATGTDQPAWRGEQTLDQDGGLEAAIRSLIDRLPL